MPNPAAKSFDPAAQNARGSMTGLAGFGPVMQFAFVPADFDAALKYWTKVMGVGPFFQMEHIAVPQMWYRGVPTTIDFSIALAHWGNIQVELVRQHDDAPSIYTEWRRSGGTGLHHVCQLVDDIEAVRRHCDDYGLETVQELALEGGRALYVDTGGGPGTIAEFIQSPPALLQFFEMVKAASRNWDGTDALRTP